MELEFIRRRITELRLARGLSEYQLSMDLGMSRSYIQSIVSGKSQPSLKQLFNICEYFDITPSQFFDVASQSSLQYYNTVNMLKALPDEDITLAYAVIQRLYQLHNSPNTEDISK